MDDLIELVSLTFTTDALKQRVPHESRRSIWGHIQSVSKSEWFQGGQNGLQPSLVVDTNMINYQGEKTAIVHGKRYSIYRTYFNDQSDTIELYLEEQVQEIWQRCWRSSCRITARTSRTA